MKTLLFLASLLGLLPALPAQTTMLATVLGNTNLGPATPPVQTVYFDINVTSATGILVSQFDVDVVTGGSGAFDIYTTAVGNTFLPVMSNQAAWTKVGSANITSLGSGQWTPALLTQPFYLAPGTYGVAFHYVGMVARYNNTTANPLIYSDANLTLDATYGRARNSTATNPFTGGTGPTPRIPAMRWYYTTAAQTVNFTATPTRGASPLAVQFTDHSLSTLPGGILAWAWDFENDGIPDSTVQNPVHTYTTCGDYTVSLTIVDTSGGYTVTKQNLIQTDLVTADFSTTWVGPTTLQFNDLSSPVPGTWAWDLDGDTVIDSTQQNPIFTYSNTCTEVNVTLTVQLACRTPVTITRKIAVASSVTTTFQGGLVTFNPAPGAMNMIDLNVAAPEGIVICAMHVNSNRAVGQPLTVNVWVTPGTYIGNERNQAMWRLAGTVTLPALGAGQRTFVQFPGGIYLPAGTFGMAIEQVGDSPLYTNMGGTRTWSNPDLTITAGATLGHATLSPWDPTATLYSPRIWNGSLFYTTANILPQAGYGFYGPGCPGTLGTSTNTSSSLPRIGTTMVAAVDNMPVGVGFLLLGFSRTMSQFGPLPLDLASFGAPGCMARVSSDITLLLLGAGTTASFSMTLPNNPTLSGIRFYSQALVLDAAANTMGAITSDAAAVIIGG